jgi:predicted DNA-binding ribbon-helix-helix protein
MKKSLVTKRSIDVGGHKTSISLEDDFWRGFDELLAKQLSDTAFVFCLVGILASLRAVQHALKNADSTLSGEHKRVIDEWWWTSH